MVLILAVMVLLQLGTSSLVRHSNGHRSQGLFGLLNERTNSTDNYKPSTRNHYSITSASRLDQDKISALLQNSSILSVIKSSSADSANRTSRSDYYSEQKGTKGRKELHNESQLSHKQIYSPKSYTICDSEYLSQASENTRFAKINEGTSLIFSTKMKQKLVDSNEVLYSEKLMTYKKNLTALLHEIKLPATTPEYDIVSPGASAEDRGTSKRPVGKPLCPAVPEGLGE